MSARHNLPADPGRAEQRNMDEETPANNELVESILESEFYSQWEGSQLEATQPDSDDVTTSPSRDSPNGTFGVLGRTNGASLIPQLPSVRHLTPPRPIGLLGAAEVRPGATAAAVAAAKHQVDERARKDSGMFVREPNVVRVSDIPPLPESGGAQRPQQLRTTLVPPPLPFPSSPTPLPHTSPPPLLLATSPEPPQTSPPQLPFASPTPLASSPHLPQTSPPPLPFASPPPLVSSPHLPQTSPPPLPFASSPPLASPPPLPLASPRPLPLAPPTTFPLPVPAPVLRPVPTAINERQRPMPTASSERSRPVPTATRERPRPIPAASNERPHPVAASERPRPVVVRSEEDIARERALRAQLDDALRQISASDASRVQAERRAFDAEQRAQWAQQALTVRYQEQDAAVETRKSGQPLLWIGLATTLLGAVAAAGYSTVYVPMQQRLTAQDSLLQRNFELTQREFGALRSLLEDERSRSAREYEQLNARIEEMLKYHTSLVAQRDAKMLKSAPQAEPESKTKKLKHSRRFLRRQRAQRAARAAELSDGLVPSSDYPARKIEDEEDLIEDLQLR